MKNFARLSLAIFVAILMGCSANQESTEIIEINITQGLENHKSFAASELIKDVEILELESNIECYIKMPHFWFLGEKYIVVFDNYSTQVLLFNRDGEFIRKIGQKGQGPGEYYGMMIQGTMDLNEEFIVVTSGIADVVIVYNIEGEVVAQKNLTEFFQAKYILGIECQLDGLISFLPHRPWQAVDSFQSVSFFDFDLNKVGGVLPRANDQNLVCNNIQHTQLIMDGKDVYFWEMYNDTIYQYDKDGISTPMYHFKIEKNGLTHDMMYNKRWDRDIYNYTFPTFVYFIGDYIIADNSGGKDDVFYNVKTEKTFSVGEPTTCLLDPDQKYNSLRNDVFGFEPVRLFFKTNDNKYLVQPFDWDRLSQSKDTDCINKLKVTHPEIRDRLIEYCDNPSEDQGVILLIMKLK